MASQDFNFSLALCQFIFPLLFFGRTNNILKTFLWYLGNKPRLYFQKKCSCLSDQQTLVFTTLGFMVYPQNWAKWCNGGAPNIPTPGFPAWLYMEEGIVVPLPLESILNADFYPFPKETYVTILAARKARELVASKFKCLPWYIQRLQFGVIPKF